MKADPAFLVELGLLLLLLGAAGSVALRVGLSAVPLFLLMGEILLRAGLSDRLYRALNVWLNRMPGGLLHTNIVSCAVFSAISGSSVATAATMGSVALPYFQDTKYSQRMVLGSLAAGGALAERAGSVMMRFLAEPDRLTGLILGPGGGQLSAALFGATAWVIAPLFLAPMIAVILSLFAQQAVIFAGVFCVWIGQYPQVRPDQASSRPKSGACSAAFFSRAS